MKRPTPLLNHPHEIHLDPFTHNGKTYRVIGTQTERNEYRFDRDGIPHLTTIQEHRHRVLCEETDERWWMRHERVKAIQDKF